MRLDDFLHLPSLVGALARLRASPPSLIVVAGLDLGGGSAGEAQSLLPSGRATIFRIVSDALIEDTTAQIAVIGVDAKNVRLPRGLRRRASVLPVQRQQTYAAQIAQAHAQHAKLLLLDTLPADCGPLLAQVIHAGAHVLVPYTSAARGISLLREIDAWSFADSELPDHVWCVAVQRLATLCPTCRQPHPLTAIQRLQIELRPHSGLDPTAKYYLAQGCVSCHSTGRSGSVALFDISRFEQTGKAELAGETELRLERYAEQLASLGELAFDDVIDLDTTLTSRVAHEIARQEQALATTQARLERTQAELRAANEVLEQRTTALVSLQSIGQALVSSNELHDLARRICRYVCDLCGADRAVLYLRETAEVGTILAVSGWDGAYIGAHVDGMAITTHTNEPSAHEGWPPGIPEQHADLVGGELRAGLCVPLIAEAQQVGMLIIHSMRRSRFEPGETALLQTFAHQAALSIQRTRLIERLNDNIQQLHDAQAALVQQERTAREMELAADVQQSILPHVFPKLPGLSFAADNHPARQVGGDFYDVFMRDETTIGLVIADVSGKGIPAALYMALTRSLLLAEARREPSPCLVLQNVNRLLREAGDPHLFVTVFYGLLDTNSYKLTFARAGHDYPLLYRQDTVEQLTGTGTVLGMLDDETLQLSEEQLQLRPGDRLMLYTDGLIDVVDPNNQRFELPRLQELFFGLRHTTPEEICTQVFAALAEYRRDAEQYDDMTLLVLGVD